MKRKVIQLAGKTLVVSLPTAWASKYNVRKGDEVEVEEQDRRIIINTRKDVSSEKTVIDISNLDEKLVWRFVFAAYIKGSDEIEIRYDEDEDAKILNRVVRALIGFAIVKEELGYCSARDLSGTSVGEFENILRRTFLLLVSVAEDGLKMVEENNGKALKELKMKDWEVNSFTAYCLRHLNKKGYDDYKKTTTLYSVIRDLEFLGDEYSHMYDDIAEQDIKVGKKTVALFKRVNGMLRLFYNLFYKFDKEKTAELLKDRTELKKEMDGLIGESTGDLIVLNHLRRIITLIFNLTESQLVSSL